MRKQDIVIFSIILIMVIITVTILYMRRPISEPIVNTPQASTDAGNLLNDLSEPHLSNLDADSAWIQMHIWSDYTVRDGYSLVNDCGQSANATLLSELDQSQKIQELNGVYPVVLTDNPRGWTLEQALDFWVDPTVTCGVSSFTPVEVSPTGILWTRPCAGGAGITSQDPQYSRDVACLQVEEAVIERLPTSTTEKITNTATIGG